jgi:hypothetical protein
MSLLKLKKGYFVASKGLFANVVNMLEEGNQIIRFSGTSKSLIEEINASCTEEALLRKLSILHPELDQKNLEEFLAKFLKDLDALNFIERT